MTRTSRWLALATLVLFPIDVIRVFNDSISFFRIFLIISFAYTLVLIIYNRNAKIPKNAFIYIVLVFVSSIIGRVLSADSTYASSALLNDFCGAVFLFNLVMNFGAEDIDKLLKYFVISQISAVPFAFYSSYYFSNVLSVPDRISFFKIFILRIDKQQFIETTQNFRIFLPYSSATILSVTMAILLIIILFRGNVLFKRKSIKWFLLICYSVLLIMSQSRTGILSVLFVLFTYSLIMSIKTGNGMLFLKYFLFGIIGMIFVLIVIQTSDSMVIVKFVRRVSNEMNDSIRNNRHFLVPLEGLNIWISDLKNFILGIGYGGNAYQTTRWTYLPNNSFLNSYVTVVVQKGLLGFMLIVYWMKLFVKSIMFSKLNNSFHITLAWASLLVSCVFYELYQSSTFWIMLSIMFIASYKICRNNMNNLEKRL